METLERRDMLSTGGTTSEIANVLYSDGYDNGAVYGNLWAGTNANVNGGNLVLGNGSLHVSKPDIDLTPTESDPVKIKANIRLDGNGVRFVTRYDGNYLGDGEYKNGMAFIVEYNSAGIYLYDQDGNTRLYDENGARSYTSIPNLDPNKIYTVEIADSRTYDTLRILDGNEEIVSMGGAVKEDPAGGRIAMEVFGSGSVFVDSMEVSHGAKKVAVEPEVVESKTQSPAPEIPEVQIKVPEINVSEVLAKAKQAADARDAMEISVAERAPDIASAQKLVDQAQAGVAEIEAKLKTGSIRTAYEDHFENGNAFGAFWNTSGNITVGNGRLALNDNSIQISKPTESLTPSPENPVTIELDFQITTSGIQILTRFDGVSIGDGEYRNALSTLVENNSLSFYLYEDGKGRRLVDDNGNKSYKPIPRLDPNKTYTLVDRDEGNFASVKLMDGDQEVARVEGHITSDPKGSSIGTAWPWHRDTTAFIDSMSVTHGNGNGSTNADSTALQTDLVFTQKALDIALADLAEKQKQQAALNGELAVAQENLREAVPYSRMHVEGSAYGSEGNQVDVMYSTKSDSATFVMRDGPNSMSVTLDHIGGEADKLISLKLPRECVGDKADPGRSAFLQMYEDGKLVDQVPMHGSGKIAVEQRGWEDLETGRLGENPIVPDVSVAAISGTAFVAATSTPHDTIYVSIEGGGIMSDRVIESEGGSELTMAQVFFDGSDNPPGEYEVILRNDKEIELDSLTMIWDGQELSLKDADDRWDASDQMVGMMARGNSAVKDLQDSLAQIQGSVQVFGSQTELGSTNVDAYPHIREYQENELYGLSKFKVTREEMDEAYFAIRPEMRNIDVDQDNLLRMRNDELGSLWVDLEIYKGVVGRILKMAVDVYFTAQRGGNQQEALAKVQNEIDIWGGVTKIRELHSIGIYLPAVDEAMAEGLRIYEENTGVFYAMQGLGVNEQRKQDYRAISEYWQIVWGGQGDPGTRGDGVVVASTGNIDDLGLGTSVNVSTSEGLSRRMIRIKGRIDAMEAQADAGGYVDPRFAQWRNVRDDPNLQRDRWRTGVDQVMQLVAEDAGEIEEEVGPEKDPRKPDVAWAEEQVAGVTTAVYDVVVEGVRVEEQLRFGEELEKYLAENGDRLSNNIAIALRNFVSNNSQVEIRNDPALATFEWTGEYDPQPDLSYYVSRPLNMPIIEKVLSHNFIITNAKYLGDPKATVISFGHNDSGNLGMVDFCTSNDISKSTHLSDWEAWLSLSDSDSDEAKRISYTLIPADSDEVRKVAFSVMEDKDYAIVSGVFGINSNSASHAIANYFGDMNAPSWRIAPGSWNANKINFGVYIRENGCGSGLYYDQELDSNPLF